MFLGCAVTESLHTKQGRHSVRRAVRGCRPSAPRGAACPPRLAPARAERSCRDAGCVLQTAATVAVVFLSYSPALKSENRESAALAILSPHLSLLCLRAQPALSELHCSHTCPAAPSRQPA